MKKKVLYYDAYMTVEATFIMPMAVIIIMLSVYWGLFCYDKSASIQCSYLAALRTSNEWNLTNAEAKQKGLEILDRLTEETFLSGYNENLYVEVGLTDIKAGVSGKKNIPFSGLREGNINQWNMSSVKKAYRLNPVSYIRRYQLLGEVME